MFLYRIAVIVNKDPEEECALRRSETRPTGPVKNPHWSQKRPNQRIRAFQRPPSSLGLELEVEEENLSFLLRNLRDRAAVSARNTRLKKPRGVHLGWNRRKKEPTLARGTGLEEAAPAETEWALRTPCAPPTASRQTCG